MSSSIILATNIILQVDMYSCGICQISVNCSTFLLPKDVETHVENAGEVC